MFFPYLNPASYVNVKFVGPYIYFAFVKTTGA